MCKQIILLLLTHILLPEIVYGQIVYFDKTYDSGLFPPENEGIWGNVIEESDSYIFTSFTKNLDDGYSYIYWVKTDFNGDTIETRATGNDTLRYMPVSLLEINSNYIVLSQFFELSPTGNYAQYALTILDSNGNYQSERKYGALNRRDYAQQVIKCNDRGFAITGQSADSALTTADIYVVKIDSLGNEEWGKYYGGTNYESSNAIVQTPDNGFLILGWSRSFGNGQRYWYLVKTDSLGNQEWQRTYGNGISQSGWGMIALSDGNYLMSGGVGDGNAKMIKINPSGDVIWQETYTHSGSENNYLYWSKELADYSIIAAGGTHNTMENDAGWLIKTDSAGNLLWQRKYNKNNGTDLFYNLLPTSDGGFLLSGQCDNQVNNTQDAWLLKVDSLGCAYEDCTVGIDEAGSKKVLVDVYPNPASEILNIELQETDETYDIELTDINGQVVYKSEIRNQKLEISISNLANGLYLFTLQNAEQRTTLKIVIQH